MEAIKQFASDNLSFDSISSSTVLYGAAAIGTIWAWRQWQKSRALPPGPRGLPLIGSSMLFKEDFIALLTRLHKEYGDVVCLGMGRGSYMVIVNRYDTIKEMWGDRGKDFMNRAMPLWMDMIDYQDKLFMQPYNDSYVTHRKKSAQSLRSAGFGKDQLESLLKTEWDEVKSVLDSTANKPIDPKQTFFRAATNVILGVIFGKRFSHGDPELEQFVTKMSEWADSIAYTEFQMIEMMPKWTWKLFLRGVLAKIDKCKEKLDAVTDVFEKLIREHEKHFDAGDVRDFIDSQIEQGVLKQKGYRYVAHTCVSFMFDSMHTTSTVMMFLIIYLMHYPKHQETIRKEINDVMNETGDAITLSKKGHFPFTEAFFNEVIRLACPAACGANNSPMEETTFRNYRIPKDCMILANFHSVLFDPATFPEPEKFDPYRFMEGGKSKTVEAFLPFGFGKRKCMGEPLVRSELFYFMAHLVANYEISAYGELPDTTAVTGHFGRVNVPFSNLVLKPLH